MRNAKSSAALLIASVIAGVVVVGCSDLTSTAPPVTPLSESTTSPSGSPSTSPTTITSEQVFRRGELMKYASRNGLETLTVWELCAPQCRQYWVLAGARPEAIVGDAGVGPIAAVTASRKGYLVETFGRPGFVVRPDGTTLPLQRGRTTLPINADTVILRPGRGQLTAADPADGVTWKLPATPENTSVYKTAVSGSGTVWAIPSEQGADLSILRLQGGLWRSISMAGLYPADSIQQGIVTARQAPARVAIAATYGSALTPSALLLVSTDAGQQWHRLIDDQTPFTLGDSMAIAGDTLYLATTGGRVWRTVDPAWTRLEPVRGLRGVIGLQSAGDRVIGWRWRRGELVSIDQLGRVQVFAFKHPSPNN